MRVLVVSAPLLGHLRPLVPLALALRAAGHDVLIAAGGDALGADTAGVPTRDVAPGFRFERVARRTMLRHPLIARAEMAGTGGTRGVGLLFGAANDEIVDLVVDLAREWRPDLVGYEPLALAGAVAAASIGVPAVLLENSLFDGPALVAATAAQAGAMLRRHGVDAVPAAAAVVTVRPPSFGGSAEHLRMGPQPPGTGGDVPPWLREPAPGHRIVVSRSTVDGPGGGDPMPRVVAVAADVDAEIVLVCPSDRLVAGSLPDNVRTVGWVPLEEVLPQASAVIHHGGAGTILGACAAGVPQLAVPGPGDRRHNAELAARRGVGLAVPARRITAATLIRLVTEPCLAATAAEVRVEMAAMPPPEAVVPALESLV